MNTQVKIYHHGAEGLSRVFDIYTPNASEANPVEGTQVKPVPERHRISKDER